MNSFKFKKTRPLASLFLAICMTFVICSAAFAAPGLEVTIYNENLALIKDTRILDIPIGMTTLTFDNISNLITAETVTFKSITDPEKVNLVEQNYEYDLVNEVKLMSRFLGEFITVTTTGGRSYAGYLLSNSTGNIILSQGPDGTGKVSTVQRSDIQSVQYPSLPNGLIIKPTLSWIINNTSSARTHEVLVTYLTKGLSWKCDYVATLSADDKTVDLTSWVTLTNNTDMVFNDAKLKLVAGDVNIVTPSNSAYLLESSKAVMYDSRASFVEESFADYHLYAMQNTTTIKPNQTKQVELFSSKNVPATKTYEFDSYDTKVKTYISFKNDELSGLGIPIPKGIIRVSKADNGGSLEFIGEDSIDHTAKDETIKLLVGSAFDITATRTLVNSVNKGERAREETYEVVIKNHKDTPVSVIVTEHPGSWYNWTVYNNTHKYEKVDASSFRFVPTINANDSVTIKYTILSTW